MLSHSVMHHLGEILIGPVAPGKPHQRETRRKETSIGEVIDRRHDLLARQVAGHAEEYEPAWTRYPRQTLVKRIAQWIRLHAVIIHQPVAIAVETVARRDSHESMNFWTPSVSS